MSSKSRKKKSTPPTPPGPPATAGAGSGSGSGGDDEFLGEDVVHVPQGRSRMQFVVMIGLLILLLVIFIVPGAILGAVGGGGGSREDPVVFTWERPGHGTESMLLSDWFAERQAFEGVLRLFPIQQLFLGIRERRPTTEDIARLLVLDALAADAGIVITDEDVVEAIQSQGYDRNTWIGSARNVRGGVPAAEENLKRVLAIRRYSDTLVHMVRVPDVEEIEELWAEEHVELAWDYLELEVATLVDDARAEAPEDEVLQAWFDGLSEIEQSAYQDPQRYKVTLAAYIDAATTPATGLLEAYPEPEGAVAEDRAQEYYNQVFFTRFQRPEDAEAEEGEDQATPQPYYSFDEVKDACIAEAPVYFALGSWIRDLQGRVGSGEEIDLVAEAAELGLDGRTFTEGKSLEDFREMEDIGGMQLGSAVARTPEGGLAGGVAADSSSMVVVRVDEIVPASMPEFSAIRDRVLDAWAEERAGELAVERLEALRANFDELIVAEDDDEESTEEDAQDEEPAVRRSATLEEFVSASAGLSLGVQRRPWLDVGAPHTEDPDATKPAHIFLNQQRNFADLEDGEVPPAQLDRNGEYAYLFRLVGTREMPVSKMTPQAYQNYKQRTSFSGGAGLIGYLTGPDLIDTYGADFPSDSVRRNEDELEDEEFEDPEAEEGDSTEEG